MQIDFTSHNKINRHVFFEQLKLAFFVIRGRNGKEQPEVRLQIIAKGLKTPATFESKPPRSNDRQARTYSLTWRCLFELPGGLSSPKI